MGLRRFIDRIKPDFEPGGKFPWLRSTFEGFETFLFVPNTVTKKGSHIRDAADSKRLIFVVVIALIPALLFGMFNVGLQHFRATGELGMAFPAEVGTIWSCLWYGFLHVLPLILVSYIVGLGIEFAFAQVRGHEINEGYLVTGLLVPLILPVDVPLWMVAVAVAFAVVIGKEVFGGTGMNIFNPALLARAFIFFAYTPYISGETVWVAGMTAGEGLVDSFSGATPLADITNALAAGAQSVQWSNGTDVWDWIVGTIPGSIGETSVIAILLGAAILLFTGVASGRIMAACLLGATGMGLLFNAIGGNVAMEIPFWQHYLFGGFLFGTVFMATDPVTSAQTRAGQWIYGVVIGAFCVLIRVVNPGYPEGMMLSILLMNAMAPLVDHYVVAASVRRRNRRLKVSAAGRSATPAPTL